MNTEKIIDDLRDFGKTLNIHSGSEKDKSLKDAIMLVGSFEQIKWERDIAIAQLHELGYSLGQKIEGRDRINGVCANG